MNYTEIPQSLKDQKIRKLILSHNNIHTAVLDSKMGLSE